MHLVRCSKCDLNGDSNHTCSIYNDFAHTDIHIYAHISVCVHICVYFSGFFLCFKSQKLVLVTNILAKDRFILMIMKMLKHLTFVKRLMVQKFQHRIDLF